MSRKFNPNKQMRIPMEKAHITYRRQNKKKEIAMLEANRDGFGCCLQPSEFKMVKGLQGGKQKPKMTKDKIFDTKNDGKPIPKKKESKVAKLVRAYYMVDGKKEYHELS